MIAQVHIALKVQPGARRTEIVGFQDDVLRVRVTAQPERGKANRAVIELLARTLGVPKRNVTIPLGAASRSKVALIEGLDEAGVRQALDVARDDASHNL